LGDIAPVLACSESKIVVIKKPEVIKKTSTPRLVMSPKPKSGTGWPVMPLTWPTMTSRIDIALPSNEGRRFNFIPALSPVGNAGLVLDCRYSSGGGYLDSGNIFRAFAISSPDLGLP